MTDSEQFNFEATADLSGVVKGLQSVKSAITDVDKSTKELIDHFNVLAQGIAGNLTKSVSTINNVSHSRNINLRKNQAYFENGKTAFTYDATDQAQVRKAQQLEESIYKIYQREYALLQQKIIKLEKDNKNYEKILQNDTIRARAYEQDMLNRKKRAPAQNAYDMARSARIEAQIPYWQYRSAHPERFGSNRYNASYQFGGALDRIGQTMGTTGVGGRIAGDFVSLMGRTLQSPVMGLSASLVTATKSVKDFTKASLEAFANMEAIKTNLSVVYSTQSQADQAFGDIAKYAVKSPFGVQQTSELAILLKQSGVYASDLMDTLKMLGDTAGGNMEKMKRIANNYAQIVSIGKASMLDMRQFAYAGIPIFEAVSKELGVSQRELRTLISDGRVTSDIIEKVFKDLTGINGIFENATAKGAETLKARIQNLKDAQQLMMSEFGDYIVNFGGKYGKDSFIYDYISTIENAYSTYQNKLSYKNSLRKEESVINAEVDVDQLHSLLDSQNVKQSETLKEAITNGINMLKKEPIEVRLARNNAGKAKYDDYLSLIDTYGENSKFTNKDLNEKAIADLEEAIQKTFSVNGTGGQWGFIDFPQMFRNLKNPLYKAMREELKELYSARSILNLAETVTPKELMAMDYSRIGEYQQIISDNINSANGKNGSVTSLMQLLNETYRKLPEQQEIEKRNQIEQMKAAQQELETVSKYLDKDGILLLSGVTQEQFAKWISNGVISGIEGALPTNNDNPELSNATLPELKNNISNAYKQFYDEIIGRQEFGKFSPLSEDERLILKNLKQIDDIGKIPGITNEQFYDTFNKNISDAEKLINKMIKNAPEDDKEFWTNARTYLRSIPLKFKVDTTGKDLNIEDVMSPDNKTIVPLWKRLLSSATGLTSTTFDSTNQALDLYTNDMAVRNMASKVISSALNTGYGVDIVGELLRTNGIYQQVGVNGVNSYQIDWTKTRDEIEKFTLKLSASTDVIDAYNQSLRDEYNVYNQLASTLMTSPESQEVKNTKIISEKVLGEIVKNADEQLVNTFAGRITDSFGIGVSYNKQTGQWEYENGESIQEDQLRVSDDILTYLETMLPEIRNKLTYGGNQGAFNSLYSNILGKADDPAIDKLMASIDPIYEKLDDEMKAILKGQLVNSIGMNSGVYNSSADVMAAFLRGDELASVIVNNQARELLSTNGGLKNFEDLLAMIEKDEKEAAYKIFTPLWKRILSSATGISANVITGTNQALGAYRDDLALRTNTSNVFAAILKNGGSVSTIQSLLKTNGNKIDGTYQIDWVATNKAVKQFATSLNSSVEVLDAYKSGIQSQIDVYTQLMSTGITSAESADNVKKLMSSKTWSELEKDSGAMLINAFGERLTDQFGNTITKIVDGKYYNQYGVEIDKENVQITGNIYDFISKELPKLYEELRSLNIKSELRKKFSEMISENQVIQAQTNLLNNSNLSTDAISFLYSNPDLLKSLLKEGIKEQLSESNPNSLFDTEEELLNAMYSAYPRVRNDANSTFARAVEYIAKALEEFLDNPNYKNIIDYNGNIDNTTARNNTASVLINMLSPSAYNKDLKKNWMFGYRLEKGDLAPQEKDPSKSGLRGVRNWLYGNDVMKMAGLSSENDIEELASAYDKLTESQTKALVAQMAMANSWAEAAENVKSIVKSTASKAFLSPFETLGEDVMSIAKGTKDWSNYTDDALISLKKVAGEMVANIGNEMATCGLRIASAAALESNWGVVAAGLGLAAAGGIASGFGASLTNTQTNNKDETEKLQSLTDQIKALLEQARNDALYYENNLRHKEALGNNSKYTQKVNDAIIAPNGNVITTAPDDYLIATKQPQNLVSRNASPTINFTVVDNAGVNVKQQKKQNADGSVEIIAIIENVVGDYIASEKGDSAFNARENRMRGHSYIM